MADIDPELAGFDLEALDPTPDVHSLFSYYNALYFDNQLGACSVEWSTKRMTLCAGVCHFSRSGGCRIKLSEPLLKFRPVKDLKETLLHEMIHAALFLGNVRDDGDHGPKFRALMNRINNATCADSQRPAGGYHITVYHTMHDEVNNYRTHVWSCTRCGNTVRRSMNRPPQEADCRAYSKAAAAAAPGGTYCGDARCWYHGHLRTCGGAYEKIAEPDKPQPPSKPASASSSGIGSKHPNAANKRRAAAAAGAPAITAFFPKQDRQQQSQRPTQLEDQQQQEQQQQVQLPQLEQQQQQPSQADMQQQQQIQCSSSVSNNPSSKPIDARAAAAAAALARATAGMAAASTESYVAVTKQSLQQQQQQQQQQHLQLITQQQQQHQAGPPLPHPARKQRQQQTRTTTEQQHEASVQLLQHLDKQQQQRAGIHALQPINKQRQPLLPLSPVQQQQQQQWPAVVSSLWPGDTQQQQHKAIEVVELLSSDDEGPDIPTAAAEKQHGSIFGQQHGSIAGPNRQLPGASDRIDAVRGFEGDPMGCDTFMCPVCCLEFSQLTALNVHLDACLS